MPADPARDPFHATVPSAAAPPRRAEAVTPSDTTDLTYYAKGLYVGQAGDVTVLMTAAPDGAAVTFKAHPIGYLPVQVRRVLETGTTAAFVLALCD